MDADLDIALKVVEILSILGGGGIVFWRMSRMAAKFEFAVQRQGDEISELKNGVKAINSLLISLTQQSGRIDRIEDRMGGMGQRVDEIVKRVNTYLDSVRDWRLTPSPPLG